jgi:hypothetical protein
MQFFFCRSVSPFLQVAKDLRESRGIALLCFYISALEGVRVHRHAPAAFYPRERPGIHCTGGWVGPRAGLDRCGKSHPNVIRSSDHPARSQSLYRLRYPTQFFFVESKLFQERRSDKTGRAKSQGNLENAACYASVMQLLLPYITTNPSHSATRNCQTRNGAITWKSENVIKLCLDIAVRQRRKRRQINVEERLMIIGRRKSKQL